ncbi:TPA: hypothetical protein ACOTHR_003056 [Clostridium perfringens]
MENTKQIVQEMREELVNHFKYLVEIKDVCELEHLESLTDAMIKIYAVLSSQNNNYEGDEPCCFEGGVLKEERGQKMKKPLEHGEGGQGQTPTDLSKWRDMKVDGTIVIQDKQSMTMINGCTTVKTDKECTTISIHPNSEE